MRAKGVAYEEVPHEIRAPCTGPVPGAAAVQEGGR